MTLRQELTGRWEGECEDFVRKKKAEALEMASAVS
jgi:hypothetical protein